jgi:elongation factor P
MIKASAVDKGIYLLLKGSPHLVVERELVNPGKGAAFVRIKLKNIQTGLVTRQVSKSHESLEDVEVEDVPSQYLYGEDDSFVFMNVETFDQFTVPRSGLEERRFYLIEGDTYQVLMWGERPLDIKVPIKMALEIGDAPPSERGDTATGASKNVTTTTGLTLKVPIFIKQGDRVIVNTESSEYVERTN